MAVALFIRSSASSLMLAVIIAGSGILAAQTADPEILLLTNLAPDRMQQELQKAADRGYRLVPLSRGWCVARFTALLEKRPAEVEPIEYLFLSTRRTATMQQELNEASERGYRFTGFLTGKAYAAFPPTIVMQRSKGTTTRTHEYILLATELASTLERELRREVEKGFRVVAAVNAFEDEYLMLLDRPVQAADGPRPDYLLEVTASWSAMERVLQAAADRGYRLFPLQGVLGGLLEKAPGDAEPIDYLVISTVRTETLQKELDKASAEGYRFASSIDEMVIAMQRAKGTRTRTHEQVLLKTSRIGTMERELRAEVANGFRVVHADCFHPLSLWRDNEHVTILERRVQ